MDRPTDQGDIDCHQVQHRTDFTDAVESLEICKIEVGSFNRSRGLCKLYGTTFNKSGLTGMSIVLAQKNHLTRTLASGVIDGRDKTGPGIPMLQVVNVRLLPFWFKYCIDLAGANVAMIAIATRSQLQHIIHLADISIASCRSSRLWKFQLRFVLRPAMLAQFDESQCGHAR